MAEKKKKSDSSENRCRFCCSYIVDIAAIVIFLASVTCEILLRKDCYCRPETIASVISILLPTIFSVISIVLSLQGEKIYGLTMNEFNRLRSKWYFTFFHKFLVFVGLVVCLCKCEILSLFWSSICLNVISVIYGIIFGFQELQILILNRRYIKEIIKESFEKVMDSEERRDGERDGLVRKAICNMLFREGITNAFLALDSKKLEKIKVLHYLLDAQNRILEDVGDHLGIYDTTSKEVDGCGVPLDVVISQSFKNAILLLKPEKEAKLDGLFASDDGTFSRQLAETIIHLKRIYDRLNLQDSLAKDLNGVNEAAIGAAKDGNLKKFSYAFMVKASLDTLKGGELWFVRSLRDNRSNPLLIFDKERCDIGLFLSVCIYSTCVNGRLSEDEAHAFLGEKSKGALFFSDSWNYYLKLMINSMNKIDIIDSLLYAYESVPPNCFKFLYVNENGETTGREKNFSLSFLFEVWLGLVLFFPCIYGKDDAAAFSKKIAKLEGEHPEEIKEACAKAASFLEEGKDSFIPGFFALFDLQMRPPHIVDEGMKGALERFMNDERGDI